MLRLSAPVGLAFIPLGMALGLLIVHAGLATGVVLLVIMASAAIGWLLTFDQMPQGIAAWVQQNVEAKW